MTRSSLLRVVLPMSVLLSVTFFSVAPPTASAQDTLWTAKYGGAQDEYGFAASQTNDGGFILTGETYSNPISGPSDLWLVKTDADGAVEWERAFGGNLYDNGRAVQQTFEGGYIVAGVMQTPNVSTMGFIVRTDASGDTLWSKTFGNRFTLDEARSVVQTTDSGFAVAGWIHTPTANDDLALIRLDSSGNTLWTRLIGGNGLDRAYSVKQTADSGFVLVGTTASAGQTPAGDAWIVKTDTAGNVEWEKNYGLISYDVATSVAQTTDGGYIVAGTLSDTGYDVWLLKTDAKGDTLWSKRFDSGPGDEAYSVIQTSDGGYAVTGTEGVNGDLWVIKTDAAGNLMWDRMYDGDGGNDYGQSIEQTSDGGLIVGGYTQSFGTGISDAWLLRFAPVSTAIESETPGAAFGMTLFPNYPNPSSSGTRIEYAFEKPTHAELTIFDLQGRIVRTLVDGFQEPGQRSVEWDGTTSSGVRVPSGAYVYRLVSSEGTASRLLMVVR